MNLLISIILSLILSGLALVKKSMTNSALVCAFIFSFIISYYGGLCSYLILVFVFLGVLVAGKIGKERREEINSNVVEKAHRKDVVQIIANVFVGVSSIVIYVLTKDSIFLVVYASVMAESLADSLASDIGVLSKREPINILTFKKGEKGMSGNVSLLGTFSSLMGSLIIGILFFIFNHNLYYMFVIVVSSFLGVLIDSLVGAMFQVKYRCAKCGKLTEKKTHCNLDTIYYKGLKIINNDAVNIFSNLSAMVISFLLLSI